MILKKKPKLLNLLSTHPKLVRDLNERLLNKEKNRKLALKFDKEYFDGTRSQGYGGYKYDGRWIPVAKKIIEIFDLKDHSKFLDIGCAKGFLMFDILDINPKIDVYGIDISQYAKNHSHEVIRNKIIIKNCKKLNFDNNFFDCVVSINTIHNLEYEDCLNSIKEIQRVSDGRAFIQVDSYKTELELQKFKDWMLTAKTFMTPKEWINTFKKAGYTGYYYWTILK